ncbi:MAG TPA: acetyl-CoA carboxylase biotin carboxylase subunit [Bacteroidota bacterium]|nr:acetyl-CoA carboxylase biotin carboxylase subunit [Candidatus Kapabacteria bacterium]HRS02232.1 acetyl-CoA carboxylase biotin carboxylase subunit [Bacteroidota bacterium]
MFNKILIANRGEIALRVIRAAKELGIKTVAIYSEADKYSLHVRFADEAVCVGPAPAAQSYLNIPAIISAANITHSDAIHPGYGFLAENQIFAEICADHLITFIGPPSEAIRLMGDKAVAKTTMRNAGVPVVPGSDGVLKNLDEAIKIADSIGYPVMLKAVAGGGGKGMRMIKNRAELERYYDVTQSEALAFFSNADLYLEKLITNSKHIEIQVFADKFGNTIHLNERECSLQRRNQKLIEETPSLAVNQNLRERMGRISAAGAKAVNYIGPGTIEYLLDNEGNFYFMEMNTRIQVEHPITEEALKYDLVAEQIRVAAGEQLSLKELQPLYYALECRINAEDPFNDWRPSPGRIEGLHFPGGFGVRVDSHLYQGYIIPPNYDSLVAKLITYGRTREQAIAKMKWALDEMVIEGIKTTIPFHKKMLENPDFLAGKIDTKYLERVNWQEI